MQEHFFQCPYCWEDISMLIDVSVLQQTYIEDCEVCCNPIQITTTSDGNNLQSLQVEDIDQ